jgi:RNA polymerase sigma factor (sigma-70 family)
VQIESPSSLLAACQSGSDAAWERLVARYENLVFSTALQAGLDRDAAVDVFQQVWIELHRSLLRIRDARALPRWLIVTTRRIAYRHAVVTGRWVTDVREDMADPTPTADVAVVELERRQQLEEGLHALGGRCEELLRLLYYTRRKVSYREIGRRLDLAEDSIGSLRTRCLARLRRILEASSARSEG